MINFYGRFLPRIARTLCPLTDALTGNPRVLNWSQELQDAFNRAKSTFSSAVSLTHPSPSAEVSLVTDAWAQDFCGGVCLRHVPWMEKKSNF